MIVIPVLKRRELSMELHEHLDDIIHYNRLLISNTHLTILIE